MYWNKKNKNPEDGYVAVETLVCLLHESMHSVTWVVPLTFDHNIS